MKFRIKEKKARLPSINRSTTLKRKCPKKKRINDTGKVQRGVHGGHAKGGANPKTKQLSQKCQPLTRKSTTESCWSPRGKSSFESNKLRI